LRDVVPYERLEMRFTDVNAFHFPRYQPCHHDAFRSEGKADLGRLETLMERGLEVGIRGVVLSSETGMHVYL
jgi:hypothetical protein